MNAEEVKFHQVFPICETLKCIEVYLIG